MYTNLNDLSNETLMIINQTKNNILYSVPYAHGPLTSSRSKRISSFFRWQDCLGTFDLSTTSSVQKVTDHVKMLHRQNARIKVTIQSLSRSSFMSPANHRVENVMSGVKVNHDMLREVSESFEIFVNFVVLNASEGSLCFQIFILHNSMCQVLCGSCKKLPRTSHQCCYIFLVIQDIWCQQY
jgi:hypothetical protein